MAIAPIPIETTTIGPSPLSAVMPDSRDLYSGYEVCSMVYHNSSPSGAWFILGIVGLEKAGIVEEERKAAASVL